MAGVCFALFFFLFFFLSLSPPFFISFSRQIARAKWLGVAFSYVPYSEFVFCRSLKIGIGNNCHDKKPLMK